MGWEIINVTQQGNEMEFTIHRTSNIYTLIFFTPFVGEIFYSGMNHNID